MAERRIGFGWHIKGNVTLEAGMRSEMEDEDLSRIRGV